jgi:hypothetical protein
MDAHEAARKHSPTSPSSNTHGHNHGNSNSSSTSSVESFGSSSPDKEREREFGGTKEGRRSITFGRKSLNLDDRPLDIGEKVRGFKGRLRALTGGRSGDVKPYPGT